MALFDFIGATLTLPLKVAQTAVNTTVRTVKGAVTAEPEEIKRAFRQAGNELFDAVDEIPESLKRK